MLIVHAPSWLPWKMKTIQNNCYSQFCRRQNIFGYFSFLGKKYSHEYLQWYRTTIIECWSILLHTFKFVFSLFFCQIIFDSMHLNGKLSIVENVRRKVYIMMNFNCIWNSWDVLIVACCCLATRLCCKPIGSFFLSSSI